MTTQGVLDEVTADKAGASRYEDVLHGFLVLPRRRSEGAEVGLFVFLVQDAGQVFTVLVVFHFIGKSGQLGVRDVTHAESYFFRTSHLQALPFLDGLHEDGSLQQGMMTAGVEPCHTAAHGLNPQLATL